jgi:hypothetical protein
MKIEWNSTEYKPDTYDLVKIKHDDDKVKEAWWTGSGWDSAKGRITKPVKMWAKSYVSHETLKR